MSRAAMVVSLVLFVMAVTWVEVRDDTRPTSVPPVDELTGLVDLALKIRQLEAARTERAPEPAPPPAPIVEPVEPPAAPKGEPKVTALLAKVHAGTATTEDVDATWELLCRSGREVIDEAVAGYRRRIATHPGDADAHYGLGLALSAKYTATTVSELEQVALGIEADACFTKALSLDDHHFGARFCKAYTYALCPPNYGLGPEAIRHFEILVRRHGNDAGKEGMHEVYYNLGKEYAKVGKFEQAVKCWREGLGVFPDSKVMSRELAAAERK